MWVDQMLLSAAASASRAFVSPLASRIRCAERVVIDVFLPILDHSLRPSLAQFEPAFTFWICAAWSFTIATRFANRCL